MLSGQKFEQKMGDLTASLPTRDGTWQEVKRRNTTYYRLLCECNEIDFVEACDRILFSDEWFPTVARLRAVMSECAADRVRSEQATAPERELVCPYCHGARWVRIGGYDPLGMKAGDDGSRVQSCPKCTSSPGRVDTYQESQVIRDEDGVPNENADKHVDPNRRTWSVPRTSEGRVDTEALYRQSRVLRGLDPNGDDRPRGTGDWKTLGDVMTPIPEPQPARELVTAGKKWSVDDVPFD